MASKAFKNSTAIGLNVPGFADFDAYWRSARALASALEGYVAAKQAAAPLRQVARVPMTSPQAEAMGCIVSMRLTCGGGTDRGWISVAGSMIGTNALIYIWPQHLSFCF